jgi:opacity protein-like surface antigen
MSGVIFLKGFKMISKITRILATAGMLAVFGLSSNSFADNSGLTSGMTAGIGGDIGFHINENSDFKYTTDGTADNTSTFNAEIDSSYAGYITIGYMMDCLEGAIEGGYRQLKEKDSKGTGSKLESKQWFGMIRGTYYLDLQSSVYPYIMAGIGIVRSEVTATMIKDATPVDPTQFATLSGGLKINKFGYEAGIGLATMLQSAVIGAGYKFFGVANLDDTDSYTGATFTDFAQKPLDAATLATMKFGDISQKIHTVEAFVKVTF